jgi:hypothetical protein
MRRALVLLGVVVMGYAVVGGLTDPDVRPIKQAGFFIAVLVAHDGILLPIAIGVGALTTRFTPERFRGILRAALFASAVVTAVALPLVLGRGRRPDIPSALPLNYPRGLLIVLGVIWIVAATAIAWREGRRRRRPAAPPTVRMSRHRWPRRRRSTFKCAPRR